jgi:hypothetical protein
LLLLCFLVSNGLYAENKVQIQYLSPKAGAILVSPKTNIILRPDGKVSLPAASVSSLFDVRGAVSGVHPGRVIVSDDQHSVIFLPQHPFVSGEEVVVHLQEGLFTRRGDRVAPMTFSFTIAPARNRTERGARMPVYFLEESSLLSSNTPSPDALSRKEEWSTSQILSDTTYPLDLPYIKASTIDNPAPGRIFLSNIVFSPTQSNTPYLLILGDSGLPIFYRRAHGSAFDFKVQPDGRLTYYDGGTRKFYAMDSAYAIVDSFSCGNGYPTDLHELQLLQNGHALVMSYDSEAVDMSAIVPGGKASATVVGLIVQELDGEKNVIFQWRSWDHFQITDATHENMTGDVIDYVHGNAIELDNDGNIMISSRHLDEITKINRQTGEIMWRFGGRNNQIIFNNDTLGFSHQHAIRRLSNGNITLFDNGNFHAPPVSRAVEYQLDEQNKTATLVWEYRRTPPNYGAAMGNVQRLENGNTLIGWGSTNPSVTEVRPDGTVAYELTFEQGVYSYRAYRFPWKPYINPFGQQHPTSFTLRPNYPNPFNSGTRIRVGLPQASVVSLVVYNQLGQQIATLTDRQLHDAGEYEAEFNASKLPSGTYYYRFSAGEFSQTSKMMLVK